MYEDIINLPHHTSLTRSQMSLMDRAAQFSPFAALTGYDAAIKETGRLTEEKIDMDEDALDILNMKFQILADSLDDAPKVIFTYFKPDTRKAGGTYISIAGILKKIDDYQRIVIMSDGLTIPMDDIVDIEMNHKHI